MSSLPERTVKSSTADAWRVSHLAENPAELPQDSDIQSCRIIITSCFNYCVSGNLLSSSIITNETRLKIFSAPRRKVKETYSIPEGKSTTEIKS